VYLDNNQTTNDRQLAHMYQLLDTYGSDPFEGIIIGNEVLFRQDLTATQLIGVINEVRQNLTSLNVNLKLATADLGSDWTAPLAQAVDVLMANVHPFFGGVVVDVAAAWTWEFFESNDVAIANQVSNTPDSIISEVGWPSGGGTLEGSVAGLDEMNTFLQTFVCAANDNGTQYFWFEAFDEPWKVIYNTPGQDWETQWGLMDVDRNLKPNITIPNCPSK